MSLRYPGKRFKEYVVAYDISDNRERGRVDKILKNYGFRIQKSVFECKLNEALKRKMIKELKLLDIKTGFIKIYELTEIIEAETIGECKEDIDDDNAYFI